jgi:hypothetical protein
MSSAAPDIRMSAQVRAVLGAEMIRRVLAAPLARARCPVCREPVPVRGPVNVVVSVGGHDQAATFAHLSCAPSVVMRARNPVDMAAAADMTMTAMLMQDDSGLLAGLVGERKSPAYLHGQTPSADLTDVGMADALSRGFELLARLEDMPHCELDWTATITDTGAEACQLLINPTTLFYDGDVLVPPGWREVTKRRGWCVLYTGSGLSDPETGDLTAERLEAAAAAGTLAAARLRITWTATR